MKSEVNKVETNPERPYPKLMISKAGTIVLFVTEGAGVSVKESSASELGIYSNHWAPSDFTDFEGTVTLSND